MVAVGVAPVTRGHTERLYDLLDRIDYRLIQTDEERDTVFRMRYDAYTREHGIEPRFDRRLSDHYDDLDNTFIYGLYIDGELATTIRVSVGTADHPDFPAMEVFRDWLQPVLDAGKVIIDPTRHATNEEFSREYPGLLPFMTTRIPWMVAEFLNADLILATVRAEHRAFYRRVFNCQLVAGPGYYPTLLKPHFLMTCDFPQQRERVEMRNPTFRSSHFERRMLLGEVPDLMATLPIRTAPGLAAERAREESRPLSHVG